MIRLIDAGAEDGRRAMARDDVLVHRLRRGELGGAVVRLHGWSAPIVTLGRGQEIDGDLARAAGKAGVPLVRRPTGGGWLLHLPGDLSVTFAEAGPLGPGAFRATARRVSRAIAAGLESLGLEAEVFTGLARPASRAEVCFERADRDEVVMGDTKAAGVALARFGRSVLVQTAIPLAGPTDALAALASRFDAKRAEAASRLRGIDPEKLGRAIAGRLSADAGAPVEEWTVPAAWESEAEEREAERYAALAPSAASCSIEESR